MNFFVTDSPIMRFFGRLGDLILLNIVFVITSLPAFTIGTALASLYAVTMKLVRGEEPSVVREYLRSYKQNFKSATICWLIMVAAGILLIVNFYLSSVFEGMMNTAVRFVLAMILGVWILIFIYIFPYIGRFETSVRYYFINSMFLSAAHILSTIMMVIISGGILLLTMYSGRSFTIALIIGVFLGFALWAYIQSFLLGRIFVKYEKQKENLSG